MAIHCFRGASPGAFPAADAPTVVIPFEPRSIMIVNEDPAIANWIEFSFGGPHGAVHGRLTPTIVAGIRVEQKVTKIWIRGNGAAPVMVIAED